MVSMSVVVHLLKLYGLCHSVAIHKSTELFQVAFYAAEIQLEKIFSFLREQEDISGFLKIMYMLIQSLKNVLNLSGSENLV